MYYGKTIPELEKLNEEYQKMFGGPPFGHMEIEYGVDEYDEYVRDIKKALKTGKTLVQLNDE